MSKRSLNVPSKLGKAHKGHGSQHANPFAPICTEAQRHRITEWPGQIKRLQHDMFLPRETKSSVSINCPTSAIDPQPSDPEQSWLCALGQVPQCLLRRLSLPELWSSIHPCTPKWTKTQFTLIFLLGHWCGLLGDLLQRGLIRGGIGHGDDGLMVGFDHLRGLFQP